MEACSSRQRASSKPHIPPPMVEKALTKSSTLCTSTPELVSTSLQLPTYPAIRSLPLPSSAHQCFTKFVRQMSRRRRSQSTPGPRTTFYLFQSPLYHLRHRPRMHRWILLLSAPLLHPPHRQLCHLHDLEETLSRHQLFRLPHQGQHRPLACRTE